MDRLVKIYCFKEELCVWVVRRCSDKIEQFIGTFQKTVLKANMIQVILAIWNENQRIVESLLRRLCTFSSFRAGFLRSPKASPFKENSEFLLEISEPRSMAKIYSLERIFLMSRGMTPEYILSAKKRSYIGSDRILSNVSVTN